MSHECSSLIHRTTSAQQVGSKCPTKDPLKMNSILDALWWWSCTQIHVSFQVTALGIVTALGAVRWEEGVVALLY